MLKRSEYSVIKTTYCIDYLNKSDKQFRYQLVMGIDKKFYIFIDTNRIEMTKDFCDGLVKFSGSMIKYNKDSIDYHKQVFNTFTSDDYRKDL